MSTSLDEKLTTTMVEHPEHWRLALCVHDDSVDVVVTSEVEDNTLIWRSIQYNRSTLSPLRALEEVVYDNPLLLSNFKKTDILIDTPRMVMIPVQDVKEIPEVAEQRLRKLYEDLDFICVQSETDGAVMAMAVATDTYNFLQRTFPQAQMAHRLYALTAYAGMRKNQGNNGKFYAHLHHDAMDIIAYSETELLMTNTFKISSVEDALFYILSAAQALNYDDGADRMLISGDAQRRDALLPLLRRRITHSMPAIFPTALFRMGVAAMQAPFELLCLSLISSRP